MYPSRLSCLLFTLVARAVRMSWYSLLGADSIPLASRCRRLLNTIDVKGRIGNHEPRVASLPRTECNYTLRKSIVNFVCSAPHDAHGAWHFRKEEALGVSRAGRALGFDRLDASAMICWRRLAHRYDVTPAPRVGPARWARGNFFMALPQAL